MKRLKFLLSISILLAFGCTNKSSSEANPTSPLVKGTVLLATQIDSLESLKEIIEIQYSGNIRSKVQIKHQSNGELVTSILKAGINENDITKARDGGFWDKVKLSLRSPYFVANRNDLLKVYILSRRRHRIFGGGDVAFYDLAETMVKHINKEDLVNIPEINLSEKGYLNTFNHSNAQAFMTSIFSESFADFIADVHERTNMEELVTGDFSEEQLTNFDNNPVDNYVDIINNEWGQELGKQLSKKYNITRETYWTATLLSNYLNDLQAYYSWVFKIGLDPFRPDDELVIRFSKKINRVMESTSGMR